MKARPDAPLTTAVVSSDERSELDAVLAFPVAPAGPPEPVARTLLGRVEDTHHPDLPGRVFVRWTAERRVVQRAWLAYVAGAAPRAGDTVLVVRPDNDPRWIVTAVLSRGAGPATPDASTDRGQTVRLPPGGRLRIESHDGTPLVELSGQDGELAMTIVAKDLALQASGRLRLSGKAVQIEGGAAGVDVRTEQDVVVRGRTVRIN